MSTQSVKILKALADDVRLGLVRKLASEPEPQLTCDIINSCTELTALSQPTVSHHISKLVDAGILVEGKRAQHKVYSLNTDSLESVGIDITKL